MAAPPNKTELVDDYPNPSTGVYKAGIGKLYDYVKGLLGATGNSVDARTALGAAPLDSPTFTTEARAPTTASTENSTRIATTAWAKVGFAGLFAANGYLKFPDWLGGLIFQWGSTVGPVDGFSAITFSLPLTFPNIVYTALVNSGDHGILDGPVSNVSGYPTLSSMRSLCYTRTGGSISSGTNVRINWIALGR